MAPRAPQPSRDILPLSDPQRTVALYLSRWSDDPQDPLRIALDHALLDRHGWRPGDRITFEPVPLDRVSRQGGLLIRPALGDEPAIKLRRDHYRRRPNPHAHIVPDGPDGPVADWPFPAEWTETFLPLEYLPGPGSPVFADPHRQWLLGELPDRRGRLTVPLDCGYLMFHLQRTVPDPTSLDVHLPAGVLHLMGWSPATPLALDSASGFDSSAPEDVLTIRRVPPGDANLRRDGAKFIASPDPAWLDRYFPALHDDAEEVSPDWPFREPTPPPLEDDAADLLRFPGPASGEDLCFDDRERDTFCVYFSGFRLGPGGLSFAIPATSAPWAAALPDASAGPPTPPASACPSAAPSSSSTDGSTCPRAGPPTPRIPAT